MTSPASTAPSYTPQERNGRQLLVLALALLGSLPIFSMIIRGAGPAGVTGAIVGYAAIFFFAYRGGSISLGLLKGAVVLMGLLFSVLLLTLGITLAREGALPSSRVTQEPMTLIYPVAVIGFAIWALFFSRSIKAFLAYQRRKQVVIPSSQDS